MISDFHFDDPDQYTSGTPYTELARWRRERPLSWHERFRNADDGFWLVTRHDDVVAISRAPSVFGTHAPLLQDPLPRDLWPDFPAGTMIANNLLTYEHGKHGLFRTPISALLTPGRISAVHGEIRALCRRLLEAAFTKPRFDWVNEVSLRLPVAVVMELVLGIPAEDHDALTRSILMINAMEDPLFSPPDGGMFRGAEQLLEYGKRHIARLMESPGNSMLGGFISSAKIDGLSGEELFLAYWFPLTAGAFDTTAATIAGGLHALLRYPEQAARLRTSPSLIPSAVEEMLRWVSPVIYFRKTALADVTFRTQKILKGQKLVLCYAAANRDEEVFAEPDRFDVGRDPNPHVSFGYGPHFCLGAGLARAMIQILLEEVTPYLERVQLDGDIKHTRSSWMNRIWSMPIRVRA